MNLSVKMGVALSRGRVFSTASLLIAALAAFSGALPGTGVRAAHGQAAYFSITGDFNTAGDQLDFDFDLSRDVPSTQTARFQTFASEGGTNAAGDVIADGSSDLALQLFDSTDTFVAAVDGGFAGSDSLMDFTLGPLPDPFPVDSYRLNLRDFDGIAAPIAVDLVGPADALSLSKISAAGSPGTSTVSSLKIGTIDTGMGTNEAVFNSSNDLTVGTLGLNAGARMQHTAGVIRADTLNLDGGTLDVQGGVLVVNDLNGLTTLDIDGFFSIGDSFAGPGAAELTVGDGQSLSVRDTFGVGDVNRAATLTITGTGVVNAEGNARIGAFGAGTAGSLVNVALGSTFSVGGDLRVGGSFAGLGGASTLKIGGGNSFTKASDAIVTGSVTVFEGSTIEVNAGGTLTVGGDLVSAGGDIEVTTSGFNLATVNVAGTFDLGAEGKLIVRGQVNANILNLNQGTVDTPPFSPGGLRVNQILGITNLNWSETFVTFGAGGDLALPTALTTTIGAGQSLRAKEILVGEFSPARVVVEEGGQLTHDRGSGRALSSQGIVEIRGADSRWTHRGTLNIFGELVVVDGGELKMDPANSTAGSARIQSGGSVFGRNGRIEAKSFLNRGSFDIGVAFTVEGDYVQHADGMLFLDIFSPVLNEKLTVEDGNATLGGTLSIIYGNFASSDLTEYSPIPLIELTGPSAGSVSGVFGTVAVDDIALPLGEFALAVTYAADAVYAQRALYGDANLDGFISQGDLDAVLLNWGNTAVDNNASWVTGDMSGDGFVSQADLDAVLLNWGDGTPPTTTLSAIPEPTSLALFALAGLALRRRSSPR